MFSREAIKNKAVLMGIQTGEMPDVDFIWSVQKTEGNDLCFGNGLTCTNRSCRWRKQCVALDFFVDNSVIAVSVKDVRNLRNEQEKQRQKNQRNVNKDNFPSLRVDPLRREHTSKPVK
jgi:hypothetical protein